MKNSSICPKCNNKKIVTPRYAVGGSGSAFDTIPINPMRSVQIYRYICLNCGYVEHWIDTEEDIKKVEEKYS